VTSAAGSLARRNAAAGSSGAAPFHHLRCIHGGYLKVIGRAPDDLRWFVNGEPWEGPRSAIS
jgi:hypothetical protein